MKKFNEFITEARKGYKVKGKAKILDKPIDIGDGIAIRGISRDTNGNSLVQLTVKGKNVSKQYKSYISSINIDELVNGQFTKDKENIAAIKSMV